MAAIRFSLLEYVNLLRMTHNKHLLVEGRDDKRLFTQLVNNLLSTGNNIDIDIADELLGSGGNRERVEAVCLLVENEPFRENLVGFVDREFREFDVTGPIIDLLARSKVNGRLIWSRGHSIENYLFNFRVLQDPLTDFSITDLYVNALVLFQRYLDKAIRIACAISLLGNDIGRLSLVRGSIDWPMLQITTDELNLIPDIWEAHMIENLGYPPEDARKITESWPIWQEKVQRTDSEIVKWVCHGHIGLKFLWATYARCIYEVSNDPDIAARRTDVNRVLQASEAVRFNACVSSWVRKILANESDYPTEIFQLLGLNS